MPRRYDDPQELDFDPATLSPNGQEPRDDGPDPFDVESLRVSHDMMSTLGVQAALLTLNVCKPSREWFFRVHPDPTYRLQTGLLTLKEDGETYLVGPGLWAELASESTFAYHMLFTAITKQGTKFLWPVRLPDADGRVNAWTKSAMLTAELAMTRWVRMQADRQLNGYRVMYADDASEPTWPTQPFQELLRIAFRETFIRTRDHIVLKRLRGEV